MKHYEITIRELEELTPEETKEHNSYSKREFPLAGTPVRYSDKSFHERRILFAEVSKEEFEAVKKAIVGIL